MDPRFADLVEHLAPKAKRLIEMTPLTNGALPANMPKAGVYLFSEAGTPLYVGRSDNMRGRYGRHCLPGATDKQASFAFRLARINTGFLEATYTEQGGRKWLMKHPPFLAAFTAAKLQIRAMEYRYVEEDHPIRQALLEIYIAVITGAAHNEFKNH